MWVNFTSVALFLACVVLPCNASEFEEKYITLPVDHFNLVSDETFQLRYLINDTFAINKLDAPILFYCGNEASIEFFARETGFVWELAHQIKAVVVFAEHRYFGKSVPDQNSKPFEYLTIEQALADFAALVNHLNEGLPAKRPVIAIGGSHGGVLAAFFRMKYPHLVTGALASSATMRKFSNMTPCVHTPRLLQEFFRNTTTAAVVQTLRNRGKFSGKDVAYEDDGVEFINAIYNFCQPLKSANDVKYFLGELESMFWRMTTTNYPYEANVYVPLPANPVRTFCSHLKVNLDGRDLIKAFKTALDVYVDHKANKSCFEFPHSNVITRQDGEAFDFQRCTEIILPSCSEGDNNMFEPSKETFEELVKKCESTYNIHLGEHVHRIKNNFGLNNLRYATNIIFSNGLLDPWSAAGIMTPPNDQTVVIIIPEGAHHIDLRYSNRLDPPSVTRARQMEVYTIKAWIRKQRRQNVLASSNEEVMDNGIEL